jgi:AcrR family transcriptional regulator
MDVRAKILNEATRCFAEKGVDGTALQEIADAVGVKKPSLLYHFPSKEALRKSVLEHLLSRWSEMVPTLLHAAARKDRFDAILDATIDFFTADPDRARLLLREAMDRPQQMRQILTQAVSPWLGLLADAIKKAQADGAMRRDVDAEAYLLQVAQLVIVTFTAGKTMRVLLGKKDRGAERRLVAELRRMAKTSIMTETTA